MTTGMGVLLNAEPDNGEQVRGGASVELVATSEGRSGVGGTIAG